MKPEKLKEWILSMSDDIEFVYRGIFGVICPFSKDNVAVTFDGETKYYTGIDDVMSDKFFLGKSLNEISEKLRF